MYQGCGSLGDAPEKFRGIPGRRSAQGDCCCDQQRCDRPVHTGVDIAEDDVPQCIGKEKSRNQKHQCANDRGIDVSRQIEFSQQIGKQCHEKAGGNLLEEGVGINLAQGIVHQSQKQTTGTRAKTICDISTVKYTQTAGNKHISQQDECVGIVFSLLLGILQPFQRGLRVRPLGTDPPAQVVVFFHRIQIGADVLHPAKLGDGQLIRYDDGDEQTVGDRVDPSFQTIGIQNSNDTLFNPVGLGTGGGKTATHFRNQFH